MRTIDEAIKELKAIDPRTAFTAHALRRKLITGEIPSVKAGTRYLVNMDKLEAYLSDPPPAPAIEQTSGIRRINERIR